LGLGFHREGFLGGYGSWERRLLRLGHVAFFGTGLLNVMFAHSLSRVSLGEPWLSVAVWGFVVGAVAMPVCCVIAARTKKAGMLFALPVLGLTVGGVLTSIGLLMHALGGAAGGATGGAG